jgi:hypothetical protein
MRTANDLSRLGFVATYLIVIARHGEASLNLLYALRGAVTGTNWNKLSDFTKAKLKREVDSF